MTALSSPIENIKEHYDVIVIGSGYGGGIAASRLSRAGRSVCLLERGKEFLPGEFPNTEISATEEMQLNLPKDHKGSKTGLFNFYINKDINVLVGCGLGGTSLINANVSLKPDPRVFNQESWPQEILDDVNEGVAKGYQRAQEMLKPNTYPANFPVLKKMEAQEKSAEYIGQPYYPLNINVTFESHVNHVGVEQKACNLCGDCITGCNHTAKNTTQMNYLPDAWNHGAEIFTECSVRHVQKNGDKWLVFFEPLGLGREKFNSSNLFVSADIVVVSAGTLGSTEIMLRSQAHGLSMSPMLGKKFNGNGDVLGFGYNMNQTINGIGYGKHDVPSDAPAGPCIASVIDTRESSEDFTKGMVIEEGVIPGALAPMAASAFFALSKYSGSATDKKWLDEPREIEREAESLVAGSHTGASKNTQTYLIMAHDGDDGMMRLEDDRLRVEWPNVGRKGVFQRANDILKKCTEAMKGVFIENPIWTKEFDKSVISVHPLGGCTMGENASKGVVNHKGQVFSSTSGTQVHQGLYVMDGSVIPCSLGVNPLFTISAISERNVAILIKENNWNLTYDLPSKRIKPVEEKKMGVMFTETMKGYFSTNESEDFTKGESLGKEQQSTFEFTLTVKSDDLNEMLENQNHVAGMTGTVMAPILSSTPLTASEGVFNLFVDYPEEKDTRRMKYAMKITDESGKTYFFEGFKHIHDDGKRLWHDTSTLYITLYDGENNLAPVKGKGILHIEATDFAKQMTTLKITNAKNFIQKTEGLLRFGKFFAGSLYDVYVKN